MHKIFIRVGVEDVYGHGVLDNPAEAPHGAEDLHAQVHLRGHRVRGQPRDYVLGIPHFCTRETLFVKVCPISVVNEFCTEHSLYFIEVFK